MAGCARLDKSKPVDCCYRTQRPFNALPSAAAIRAIVDKQKACTFSKLGKAPLSPFKRRLGAPRRVERGCDPSAGPVENLPNDPFLLPPQLQGLYIVFAVTDDEEPPAVLCDS